MSGLPVEAVEAMARALWDDSEERWLQEGIAQQSVPPARVTEWTQAHELDHEEFREKATVALAALPAGVYVSDGQGKVTPFEAFTPEEAKIVRLVACGLKGAPQGTMWDGLIDKLKRIAALSATDTETAR
jgi:hypothetical protein